MKITTKVLLELSILFLMGSMFPMYDYVIYKNNGKDIIVPQMAKELISQQVVFFGEYQGDSDCRAVEEKLLVEMYTLKHKLVISLETLSRDFQPVLDGYLTNKVTSTQFQEKIKYQYGFNRTQLPIIEFARERHLPVIAGNVPFKYSHMLIKAKGDFSKLLDLPDSEKVYFSNKPEIQDDEYKRAYISDLLYSPNGDEDNMIPQELMDYKFKAQCLEDNTIAESLQKAHEAYPGYTIIHINNAVRSRNYWGTVRQFKKSLPNAKLKVISPVYIDSMTPLEWDKSLNKEGDYLILIHKVVDMISPDNSE
jgi:uncharacterized iron-regulated protein